MKSSRHRRIELTRRRAARKKATERIGYDVVSDKKLVTGMLASDPQRLAKYAPDGPYIRYYEDMTFQCRECDSPAVWRAEAQKEWHEVCGGHIFSRPKLCHTCRIEVEEMRNINRKKHIEGLVGKYGVEEASRRLRMTRERIEAYMRLWAAPAKKNQESER